jgi:long-subunit fatty acid transport protein
MIGDDYTIKTPAKYTGSAAFVIGKKGLISIDYAMRNYANTKYTGNRYSVLNDQLSQTLDWAGELRVGTEWRIKQLSLRAGYRFQQSPYKNGTTVGDLSNINGGLGYSFGGSRVDLTYSWAQRKSDVSTFTPGFTDTARVKTTYNNVVLSYTIDL